MTENPAPVPLHFPEDVVAELPHAHGGPPLRGRFKAHPEDFEVVERLGYAPDGEGEHLLLEVRKRGLDTLEVARRLAAHAGLHPRAVGFAGLKDRHAVTTQCFSLHLPKGEGPDWRSLEDETLQIRVLGRHRRKLRRGRLAGNAFRLRLREVAGDRQRAEAVLQWLAGEGFPSYFGPQRFGRGSSNLIRAQSLLLGRLRRPGPEQLRMLISAARSWLFNQVLAERVRRGDWNRLLPGEVALLTEDGRPLPVRRPEELEARLAAGELHPSGPLPGRPGHCLAPDGEAVALEHAVLQRPPLDAWVAGLARRGADAARRPLRAIPRELAWEWGEGELLLRFELPAGSYATSLVRELLGG